MIEKRNIAAVIIILLLSFSSATAQISPGELATPHAHLEGISNCTQCHVLGSKVSSEKCLACHTEIKDRQGLQKGYHASSEVKGKDCFACHNDHHGRKFQLIRLDTAKFDHSLTGYSLSVPHAKKGCNDCHSTKYISDEKLKAKKYTYLGLNQECLTCHTDYHKKTLSPTCLNCHNADSFKPASKFNHDETKFQLSGKHAGVLCIKCHKIEMSDGKKFQQFKLNKTFSCSDCHKDPHNNKFGQNCSQCHNEDSFTVVKGAKDFDHNKTDYKLEGKHLTVNCKACHKTKFTDPLKTARCIDCHSDYHKNQFVKNGVTPDCSECHTLNGFSLFSYTIEQHNLSYFPLKGAHNAIPCTECHKKQNDWSFREIGTNCKDCHEDPHRAIIDVKYYPGADCKACHVENRWKDVTFDHSKTEFALTGGHKKPGCRDCHFMKDTTGNIMQKFAGLSKNCSDCHADKHFNQFEKNGITNCTECHDTENWKASKFNHDNTNFRLDGKHINVPCLKCHKPEQQGSYYFVRYKLIDYRCESCHS
jgi:hypothetical protein